MCSNIVGITDRPTTTHRIEDVEKFMFIRGPEGSDVFFYCRDQ
jgi:hypothetical protein